MTYYMTTNVIRKPTQLVKQSITSGQMQGGRSVGRERGCHTAGASATEARRDGNPTVADSILDRLVHNAHRRAPGFLNTEILTPQCRFAPTHWMLSPESLGGLKVKAMSRLARQWSEVRRGRAPFGRRFIG